MTVKYVNVSLTPEAATALRQAMGRRLAEASTTERVTLSSVVLDLASNDWMARVASEGAEK